MTRDIWEGDYNSPMSLNRWMYANSSPIRYADPSGYNCYDPWAPSGIHFDEDRDCEYPEGSTGKYWWGRDPLGPDTAVIDMPWVDEQSPPLWNQYPNTCGAAALYMFLRGEGVVVDYPTLIEQLRKERPGGYDGYCCRNPWNAEGTNPLPTVTPDPLGWCNRACVSAEALADVARTYYGLDIISGDNWTHDRVYNKVRDGHPVLALVRVNLESTGPGHFVTIRGFRDRGWTVFMNDSYPNENYWDSRGGSYEKRRQAGEARETDWDIFDASWASSVDRGLDPLALKGHKRWAMSVK